MSYSPIRRAQIITPFGVGALHVAKNGDGLIAAGLDSWFSKENIDKDEFIIREWRLERQLKVNHFYLPPDFRKKTSLYQETVHQNSMITIPFFKFPQWHFCPVCRRMQKVSLESTYKVKCKNCRTNKKIKYPKNLIQVPFVTVCPNGHIDDFPWNEWAHSSVNPACSGNQLELKRKPGKPGLSSQAVKCNECGSERDLSRILSGDFKGDEPTSYITEHLDKNNNYLCKGKSIWHGNDQLSSCNEFIIGSLRASSNLYSSLIESSILVPERNETIEKIFKIFNTLTVSTWISIKKDDGESITVDKIRNSKRISELFADFTDTEIHEALEEEGKNDIPDDEETELTEEIFRRPEYDAFNKSINQSNLITIIKNVDDYHHIIKKYFDTVTLVKKLTETKTLYGFARINPTNNLSKRENKKLLWKNEPPADQSWLPAIQVQGEGIFLKFREDMIREFEERDNVNRRISDYLAIKRDFQLNDEKTHAGYMMMHTFAHILLNTLIFECGYGAASLQERIYYSSRPDQPMNGVLIYTAAGDSSGTMGGLVRMGNPSYLERMIEKTIRNAKWCSIDPVCMESGSKTGQGPNSVNLAACHNCALVPETSCESFNSYLDRALLTGTFENPDIGFFNDIDG